MSIGSVGNTPRNRIECEFEQLLLVREGSFAGGDGQLHKLRIPHLVASIPKWARIHITFHRNAILSHIRCVYRISGSLMMLVVMSDTMSTSIPSTIRTVSSR